jgi:hypothetical protein
VHSCLLRRGAIQRSPSSRVHGTCLADGSGTRSGAPATSATPIGTTPRSQRTTPPAARMRPLRRTTTRRARTRTRAMTTTSISLSLMMAVSCRSYSLQLLRRRQGAATSPATSMTTLSSATTWGTFSETLPTTSSSPETTASTTCYHRS